MEVTYKNKQIDIPEKILEQFYENCSCTGWEEPQSNTNFFAINTTGNLVIIRTGLTLSTFEKNCIQNVNAFNSKLFATNIYRYQLLVRKILKRISEICEPIDFNNRNIKKWYISYNKAIDEMFVASLYEPILGNVLACDTEEHAFQIINEFHDNLKWYFTEFKTRLDKCDG